MPSIPQSLLWISLVVLWLFVLVPMLINKRDTVRRTSDVALATRVLNSGARSRLIKKSGPAAGHRHDPDWQADGYGPEAYAEEYPEHLDEADEFAEQQEVIREYDDAVREARMGGRARSVVVVAAMTERAMAEPDYLDVDVVEENSGALPVGDSGVQASLFDEPVPQDQVVEEPTPVRNAAPPKVPPAEPRREPVAPTPAGGRVSDDHDVSDHYGVSDDYEYVGDSDDLEAEEPRITAAPRSASRQRRMENTTAAAVSARKYRFRKRVLTAMTALIVITAALAATVDFTLWWACGAVSAVTVLYLGYLRRQTRIEAQVRRRRQQRQARPRAFVEEAAPPRRQEVDFDEFPTRLQRPGAVVLEVDDEDPVFEHLDEMAYSGSRYRPTDLPRASGQ